MRHSILALVTAAVMLLGGCAGPHTADTTTASVPAIAVSSGQAAPESSMPASTSADSTDIPPTGASNVSGATEHTAVVAPPSRVPAQVADDSAAAAQAANSTGIPGRSKPAPPMSTQLPPEQIPETAAAPRLDTSCRTASDCAVKNVGSCCGAMPACVNRNSPTNPEAVKAQCARNRMMSTCGYKDVQSCSCVAGTCRDSSAAGAEAQ